MYLSAKLIGIASTFITAGTASSFLIPYLKSVQNNWFFQKDIAKNSQDFKELDRTAEERINKLTDLLNKFQSAKNASLELKKTQLEKMKPLFENIFAIEEEIKQLFEDISKTLDDLVNKNATFFDTSTKKLEAEKKEKLQKELQKKYSAIQGFLKQWRNSLKEISCVIDRKGVSQEGNGGCKQVESTITEFLTTVGSLLSAMIQKNGETRENGASGGTNGQASEGAEKAKKDLESVKEVLLETIKDFNKQNSFYQVRHAYSLSKEKMATMLLVVFQATINSLNQQITELKESIEAKQKASNEKSETIQQKSQNLETTYNDYSSLQRMESLFQWWKAIFEEKITKNQDDKGKETDLLRRRDRK